MIDSSLPKNVPVFLSRKMTVLDRKSSWPSIFGSREMWKAWIGFNALVIIVNFYLDRNNHLSDLKSKMACFVPNDRFWTKICYFWSKYGHLFSWKGLFRPGNLLKSELMIFLHENGLFWPKPICHEGRFLIFINKSNRGMKYFSIFMSHQ